jgi:hypothetical protein
MKRVDAIRSRFSSQKPNLPLLEHIHPQRTISDFEVVPPENQKAGPAGGDKRAFWF